MNIGSICHRVILVLFVVTTSIGCVRSGGFPPVYRPNQVFADSDRNHGEVGKQAITVGVRWPTLSARTTQTIPPETKAVRFTATPLIVELPAGSVTIVRNGNGGISTASIPICVGDYIIRAHAYGVDAPNDSNPILAAGAASVTVVKGENPPIDIELKPVRPEIQMVIPNNAAQGEQITVLGDNFGLTEGNPFVVEFFSGATVSNPIRLSDTELKVTVPSNAITGEIRVSVGSNECFWGPFRVLKALSINYPKVDLLVGNSIQIATTAIESDENQVFDPALKWKLKSGSSIRLEGDASISTNSVLVTGILPGDSVVGGKSGILSATSSIHVFKIDGVNLTPASLTLNAMPEEGNPDPGYTTSATLSATVSASDSSSKTRHVIWSSSDESKATVNSNGFVQTVRGAEEGVVTIRATSEDDPRYFATASIRVTALGDIRLEVK